MGPRSSFAALGLLLLAGCDSASGPSPADAFPIANPAAVEPTSAPLSGPWYHAVRSAASADGLSFVDERVTDLVRHASVPSAIRLADGTLVVYFVDFSAGGPERVSCVVSRDRGSSYRWGGCDIAGLTSVKAVDPCPVLLPDGRVRLYYYASANDVNSAGPHTVESAISSDGVHFVREGAAFAAPGLVDPDVFWTGATWVMHVFSMEAGGTVVATSVDGRSFVQKGVLEPRGYGVTQPVQLADGTFRMYAFAQPDAPSFVSFRSSDGLAWSRESGVRFQAPAGVHVTDPFVVARGDGRWMMVYKKETAR